MRYAYKKIDQIISPHSHVVKKISDEIGKGILVANFPIVKDLEDITVNTVSKKDPIICYTGTVYSYSNQEEIIESISSMPIVLYEVAGVIGEVHKNSLLKMSGGDKVVFHGHINQGSLRDLYQRSLVGIVVYDYKLNLGYNLGSYGTNKLFEYMEAGLPVICTDYLLWKEIIEEYKCGFYVTPGDVCGIRRAIETLVRDRNLAYEMSRNSRRAALVKFNWESEKIKYLTIFNKLNLSAQDEMKNG
jgi:glycosyltransferase involved in cell wall biosynthesis